MRKNEYNSLDEFKSQYIGIWEPANGHWFGLDFRYKGIEYRLNTGSMHNRKNTVLADGREAVFGLYRKDNEQHDEKNYCLLEEFATLDDALNSRCIDGIPFSEVIMNDETELLGQD